MGLTFTPMFLIIQLILFLSIRIGILVFGQLLDICRRGCDSFNCNGCDCHCRASRFVGWNLGCYNCRRRGCGWSSDWIGLTGAESCRSGCGCWSGGNRSCKRRRHSRDRGCGSNWHVEMAFDRQKMLFLMPWTLDVGKTQLLMPETFLALPDT